MRAAVGLGGGGAAGADAGAGVGAVESSSCSSSSFAAPVGSTALDGTSEAGVAVCGAVELGVRFQSHVLSDGAQQCTIHVLCFDTTSHVLLL